MKNDKKHTPESLFQRFNNMTEWEYAFISNCSDEETNLIIKDLYHQGKIEKYESKNGLVWTYPCKSKKMVYNEIQP